MAFEPFSWTCKYCGQPTTISEHHCDIKFVPTSVSNSDLGWVGLYYRVISCPNPDCKKLTLKLSIDRVAHDGHGNLRSSGETFHYWDYYLNQNPNHNPIIFLKLFERIMRSLVEFAI